MPAIVYTEFIQSSEWWTQMKLNLSIIIHFHVIQPLLLHIILTYFPFFYYILIESGRRIFKAIRLETREETQSA